MTAGGSVLRWGEEQRRAARRGVWRRLLAWLGWSRAAQRADALAARARQGALGEQMTAALLSRLPAGWTVWHDRALPGRRFNLDHVLVPPSGLGVIVLDSKKWHARYPTTVVRGRLHCGTQDRHNEAEAVAGYASAVAARLGVPASMVVPMLVVHGSPVGVRAGAVDVRVPKWERMVRVVGADLLLPTLAGMPGGRDPVRAAALAQRVRQALPPA